MSGPATLPDTGPAAPPRTNGELVFDAPWQSRAFGVAAALADGGHLDWAVFQRQLIERIGEADAIGADTGDPSVYWTAWLAALGGATSSWVPEASLTARIAELAARPAGHDHDHPHDHDHAHDHDHPHL